MKSLRYMCLHRVESAVAMLKCLQTDDSLTTERTSSSLRTRRRSSGGRAARPNATGRAIAEKTRDNRLSTGLLQQNLQLAENNTKAEPVFTRFRLQTKSCSVSSLKDGLMIRTVSDCGFTVVSGVCTFSGCSDQRVHQLVFEDTGQFPQVFEGCSCTFS